MLIIFFIVKIFWLKCFFIPGYLMAYHFCRLRHLHHLKVHSTSARVLYKMRRLWGLMKNIYGVGRSYFLPSDRLTSLRFSTGSIMDRAFLPVSVDWRLSFLRQYHLDKPRRAG